MMSNISKSPDRYTFQKQGYIKRQEDKGDPVNDDYLDLFEKLIEDHRRKWDDPRSKENNLEYDLLTTDWILEKARKSESYAQNIYAALCNVEWRNRDLWPTLKEQNWGCSWRYAGGIVADMRQEGDYIDWYCSGIGFYGGENDPPEGFVPEGMVTKEIEEDFFRLGWIPIEKHGD